MRLGEIIDLKPAQKPIVFFSNHDFQIAFYNSATVDTPRLICTRQGWVVFKEDKSVQYSHVQYRHTAQYISTI